MAARIAGTMQRSRAKNTRRSHTSDWELFARGVSPTGTLPSRRAPLVVAWYLLRWRLILLGWYQPRDTYTKASDRA
ncbi:hypothetical protein HYG77_25205 [Rhodococcus sp. ZPP]|uniref:hypothetical protein n=1 Tax=Rhodococcus sp. ZPP TaxID=2749906 RepID=UPI001AD85442|nr:hypothetical protein [Rhodococcus sp. ZPP]QTJ68542.1 hypothetical protein HYG77_25205 [Rhodococcus sp. ZPP]